MPRAINLGVLENVRIASPCSVSWDDMEGDERVRHCRHCSLNVYNLSALSRTEAEELIASREGRMCAGFFRRADGTILTRDCPVGLRALRARTLRASARIAAAALLLLSGALAAGAKRGAWSPRLADLEPFATIRQRLRPTTPVTLTVTASPRTFIMGKVAATPLPPPPPQPQPGPTQPR